MANCAGAVADRRHRPHCPPAPVRLPHYAGHRLQAGKRAALHLVADLRAGGQFLEELLSFFNRNVLGSLSRATNLNITYRFYRHMLRLPLAFYQGLSSTGQVLSRLNEVTSAQQTVIQVMIDTVVNTVLVVIYTFVLFLTDWRMTLVVIAVAPFYVGVSLYFNRKARRFSRQVLESYAVMNGAMYEGLTGLKTVKALAAEHRFGRKIKKLIMHTNQLSFQRTLFQSKAN